MSVLRAIEKSFKEKDRKGWDKTYWFFDLHGTVVKPNYQYGNIPNEFYPHAKEALQLISKMEDVCMIIFTCSHPHEIDEYVRLFAEHNIRFHYINENPEVTSTPEGYGCFDKKPYMNVLFEDKAGFDPETEWEGVRNYVENLNSNQ
jgi:hypothetical protein